MLFGCRPEQSRLVQELAATESELSELPNIKLDTFVPTLGYISEGKKSKSSVEHITVTFPEPKHIDTVVLIPAYKLNDQNAYTVNRFPLRFKIEAQIEDGELIQIADHTQSDFPAPGIAPVVFSSCDERPVKDLTLTVTKRSRGFAEDYLFLLNELLVFSDEENVALNAAVSCETTRYTAPESTRFDPTYLVDGYTYFPPYEPAPIPPYTQFIVGEEEIHILFDLGKVQTLDEARLYPNDLMVNFSHIHSAGIGFPMEIELQISPTPSFEDATPIVIAQSDRPINMSSSPLRKKFSPATGRYVKIRLGNGRLEPGVDTVLLSLSEIELLHNGENRLSGIPLQSEKPLVTPNVISPTVLTDGYSIYGKIVPEKQWLLQLARRAELEKKRAALLLEKETLYNRQKKELRILIFSLPLLALSFLIFLLGNRYLHRKKVQAVRERIADDLHDEVGAALTGIANASELLTEIYSATSPKEKQLLSGITQNARSTAEELHALIRFLEHKTIDSNLIEQFNLALNHMLSGMTVKTDFTAEAPFNALPPIQKWDLLLFFKEALNNIVKHADADAVEVSTQKRGKSLQLQIRDNGIGLPENIKPEHLINRAKTLRAKIDITSPETGGTRITCTLPWKKYVVPPSGGLYRSAK